MIISQIFRPKNTKLRFYLMWRLAGSKIFRHPNFMNYGTTIVSFFITKLSFSGRAWYSFRQVALDKFEKLPVNRWSNSKKAYCTAASRAGPSSTQSIKNTPEDGFYWKAANEDKIFEMIPETRTILDRVGQLIGSKHYAVLLNRHAAQRRAHIDVDMKRSMNMVFESLVKKWI